MLNILYIYMLVITFIMNSLRVGTSGLFYGIICKTQYKIIENAKRSISNLTGSSQPYMQEISLNGLGI